MKLKNFVMVKFSEDTMVDPKDSEVWYNLYPLNQPGSISKIFFIYRDAHWMKEESINVYISLIFLVVWVLQTRSS